MVLVACPVFGRLLRGGFPPWAGRARSTSARRRVGTQAAEFAALEAYLVLQRPHVDRPARLAHLLKIGVTKKTDRNYVLNL